MADANLKVLDGDGNAKYLKEAGAGTDGDPHIPSVNVAVMPANTLATGTIDAVGEVVQITLPAGCATVAAQITGTWVGTLNFEGTIDGTNYRPLEGSSGTVSGVSATAINDIYSLPGAGLLKVQVRASAWTSGAAAISLNASIAGAATLLTAAIPAGTALIGKVGIDQATANANEVVVKSITAGNNNIGDVDVASLPTLPAGNNNIGDVDVASIAAGTNLIGKTGIDQVTPNANEVVVKSGTLTAVTGITNALPAGTNLMGKVGIDQVTANANEVVLKSGTLTAVTGITNALPAGTNNIGDVDVATLPALPAGANNIGDVDVASIAAGNNNIGDVDVATIAAGANIIGKVGIDQTTPGTTNKVVASVASGGIASGAVASGAIASGAVAAGAVAAGAVVSGAVLSGAFATGAIVDLPAKGQAAMAASVPVTVASDQSAVAVKAASGAIASGAIASGAVASGAISAGAVAAGAVVSGAILSGALASGAIVDLPVKGQAAMAASVPVTVASDQSSVLTHGGGISISVTPAISAGVAYAAKDAVGGEMTFANAVRVSGGSGVINTVMIADNDSENASLELWLFSATVTEAADNAAMDFTDAEMLTCVGVIPISAADYYTLADNGAACIRGVGLQFKCAATSLFGQLKCTATPTYTAVGDLTVTLAIEYLN
jgi:hypothetical protein